MASKRTGRVAAELLARQFKCGMDINVKKKRKTVNSPREPFLNRTQPGPKGFQIVPSASHSACCELYTDTPCIPSLDFQPGDHTSLWSARVNSICGKWPKCPRILPKISAVHVWRTFGIHLKRTSNRLTIFKFIIPINDTTGERRGCESWDA